METKNTKQRLDDLQDLLQAGYLTESEFRVARINTLRESGVDIVIHGSRKPEAKYPREEEEEPKGCGCFLTIVLLAALGIGAVFFAFIWPDRLGGPYVRAAREWVSAQWSNFFSDAPSGPVPDPVPQKDVSLPAIVVIISDDQRASPVSSPDALPSSSDEPLSRDSPPSPPDAVSETEEPTAQASVTQAPAIQVSVTQVSAEQVPVTQVSAAQVPGARVPATEASPEAPALLVPSPAPPASSLTDRVSLPSLDSRVFALPAIEISEEPKVVIVEAAPSAPSAPAPAPRRNIGPETPLRRGVVSARSARIRSAPDTSTNDNVVGWGTKGDRFSVLERGAGRDGSTWYHVRYEEGGKQGWISGTLVTLE
jgi:hypothetical protein